MASIRAVFLCGLIHAVAGGIVADLQQLAELREKGNLDDDQYERAVARALDEQALEDAMVSRVLARVKDHDDRTGGLDTDLQQQASRRRLDHEAGDCGASAYCPDTGIHYCCNRCNGVAACPSIPGIYNCACTESPTTSPSDTPTKAPTRSPTEAPTRSPTEAPTQTVADRVASANIWLQHEDGKVVFGPKADVSLRRDGANMLRTDGDFVVGGLLRTGGGGTDLAASLTHLAARLTKLESYNTPTCEILRYLAGACRGDIASGSAYLARAAATETCSEACIHRYCGREKASQPSGCGATETDTHASWEAKGGSFEWPHKPDSSPAFCRRGVAYENDIQACHWVHPRSDPTSPCVKGYSFNGNYIYSVECTRKGGDTPGGLPKRYCCCEEYSNAGVMLYSGLLNDNARRYGGAWTSVLDDCPMLEGTFGTCTGHGCAPAGSTQPVPWR